MHGRNRSSVSSQMEVTELSFSVLLFIMLYKVGLHFKSVGEIVKCGH